MAPPLRRARKQQAKAHSKVASWPIPPPSQLNSGHHLHKANSNGHCRYASLRSAIFTAYTTRASSSIAQSIGYSPVRMRYFSSPESLTQPSGRGLSARVAIFRTTRRKSLFGSRSSSFSADGLNSILRLSLGFPFREHLSNETGFSATVLL